MQDNNSSFEHGRIPLKPLAYKNKDLAYTNELIVDYGNSDSTYELYIADGVNPSILHNLTEVIINNILPNFSISANQLDIDIEGVDEPLELQYLLNYIYKRFLYPEDTNGFNPLVDTQKILDATATNMLLTYEDGVPVLPVTLIDNVYDRSGKTMDERLKSMTKLGFSTENITAESAHQSEFEFTYPTDDYDDLMLVYVDGKFCPPGKYLTSVDDTDESIQIITIIDSNIVSSISAGSVISIIFVYNSAATSDGINEKVSGNNITNYSIPTKKLTDISDSYALDSSSTLATSKAVCDLYNHMIDLAIYGSSMYDFSIDNNTDATAIYYNSSSDNVSMVDIAIAKNKNANAKLKIVNSNTIIYTIKFPDGTTPIRGFAANRTYRFYLDYNTLTAYLLNSNTKSVYTYKYICADQETEISYSGLTYYTGDSISVYRNGVRLFEDIDYSINSDNETITLFTRTENGEYIVFENA